MNSPAEASVDQVLVALADPTRRSLLEVLGRRPERSATTLADEMPISRQAVVKHLATLEEAGLVQSRRSGREVLFAVRPQPLVATASWMRTLAATWEERLHLLKHVAEADPDPRARG